VIVRRFNERRVGGLLKQPNHAPGKTPLSQKMVDRVLKLVQTEQPKDATHWSTREIAKQVGISHTKAHQILQAHELKPHLVKRFRSSDDPAFEQKLEDIVGLYLNSSENAIVLSIDEKSQVQALERTQPILPLRQVRALAARPRIGAADVCDRRAFLTKVIVTSPQRSSRMHCQGRP
jgi:hypothetical protein